MKLPIWIGLLADGGDYLCLSRIIEMHYAGRTDEELKLLFDEAVVAYLLEPK